MMGRYQSGELHLGGFGRNSFLGGELRDSIKQILAHAHTVRLSSYDGSPVSPIEIWQ